MAVRADTDLETQVRIEVPTGTMYKEPISYMINHQDQRAQVEEIGMAMEDNSEDEFHKFTLIILTAFKFIFSSNYNVFLIQRMYYKLD